jgi:hypothetical protein
LFMLEGIDGVLAGKDVAEALRASGVCWVGTTQLFRYGEERGRRM